MAEQVVKCPGCQTSLALDTSASDKFQCPQCGKMMALKRPGAPAPPPRVIRPVVAVPPPRKAAVRAPPPDDDEG